MKSPSLLLVVAAILLTGCLPESRNPIAPPAQTIRDRRLEGVWEHTSDQGERTFYHMGWHSGGKAQWLDIVGVSHDKDSSLDSGGYRALPAKIGANTFLSFKEAALAGPQKPGENYSFARYDFTWRGDLRLRLASESALAAAVKSGALRGTVKGSDSSPDVLLTDTSARIAAFVGRSDVETLFDDKPMLLKKVRAR